MEAKKTKKADLSHKKGMYFNLGLVLAMAFVISAFEWKSYGEVVVCRIPDVADIFDPIVNVPITTHDIPMPPKLQPVRKFNPIFVEEMTAELTELQKMIEPIEESQIEYPVGTGMDDETVEKPPYHTVVEKMPEFEGGYSAFMKYVAKKIKYPSQARRMGIEGRVFVEFIINETGELTEIRTIKGIGAGCDEEAERVLKNAPKWSPGKQRGIPVKVKMVLPINFQLGTY